MTILALVAQGIEHRIPNPGVACSIHAEGTKSKYYKQASFPAASGDWGLFLFVRCLTSFDFDGTYLIRFYTKLHQKLHHLFKRVDDGDGY